MPLLLQAVGAAPGEARIEIRGSEIASQEIEISIQRGSDDAFIGPTGAWGAEPYWHRLHRLPGDGSAFQAGPSIVDALAEVARADAFRANLRWAGGSGEGVLRIKGELITRAPDLPTTSRPLETPLEIQGAAIPAETTSIELVIERASDQRYLGRDGTWGQAIHWHNLPRLPSPAATRFQTSADIARALAGMPSDQPPRVEVRWGTSVRVGELRIQGETVKRSDGTAADAAPFVVVLDPETAVAPAPSPPVKPPLVSPRLATLLGLGLVALVGTIALATWLMSPRDPIPVPDPIATQPRASATPPEPAPGNPAEVTTSDPTDSAATPAEGQANLETSPDLTLVPSAPSIGDTPPITPPSEPSPSQAPEPGESAPPAPSEQTSEIAPADSDQDVTLETIESGARDPETYRLYVQRIETQPSPNCAALLLLHSKAATAHPEIAATVAGLYDPQGFRPSTCIARPSPQHAIDYYELAAEGGVAGADEALARLRGKGPTGLDTTLDPAPAETFRHFENRP